MRHSAARCSPKRASKGKKPGVRPPAMRFTLQAAHEHLVRAARRTMPPLADALENLGPVWFPSRSRDAGPASVLARSVVGQQLSVAAASTIWRRIQEAAAADGTPMPVFFRSERLDALRVCGVSSAKAKTLIAIGAFCRDGLLDRTVMRRLGPEKRRASLLVLPGVGPWTCDMLEIFYFRSPDIWPMGDAAAMGLFRRYLEAPSGTNHPLAQAEPFRPFRSILSLALWRLVSTGLKRGPVTR